MIYIGIDNGATGSIGWVNSDGSICGFFEVDVIVERDFTKKAQNISRLDWRKFRKFITSLQEAHPNEVIRAYMENPMRNGMRFQSSIVGAMCHEATRIILEMKKIGLFYIAAPDWQKKMIPNSKDTKKDSLTIGIRTYPMLKKEIQQHKDADGLLIAEYARLHL